MREIGGMATAVKAGAAQSAVAAGDRRTHIKSMRMTAALVLALLLARPAVASEPARPAAPLNTTVSLSYSTYVAGMTVFTADADVEITPRGYRVDLASRTAGAYGALFHGETHSVAQGRWAGTLVAPARYAIAGHWRGKQRLTLMDYAAGQPTVLRLEPPNEAEREAVPAALQRETVDTISAAALLVRRATQTGRCEGEARTFDGRRLIEVAVHTAGWETVPQDHRSAYAGPALRCDFNGRLLAGFMLDSDRGTAARPQTGTAWLARLSPDGPLLPVRLRFDMRWLGGATMVLTGASANGPPLVQTRADALNGAAPLHLP